MVKGVNQYIPRSTTEPTTGFRVHLPVPPAGDFEEEWAGEVAGAEENRVLNDPTWRLVTPPLALTVT